jgi:hypothetical protein
MRKILNLLYLIICCIFYFSGSVGLSAQTVKVKGKWNCKVKASNLREAGADYVSTRSNKKIEVSS